MDSNEPTRFEITPPVNRPGLTVLFTFLIFFAQAIAQDLVVAVFYGIEFSRHPQMDVEKWIKDLQFDGTVVSVCTLAGMLVVVPLTIVAARRLGGGVHEVLALRWPTLRSLFGWLGILLAFIALTDGLMALVGREVVPPFMESAYESAHPRILLWLALLIAAPISEELLFRGLLFGGLARSALRPEGAALVSALAWATLHLQYDLYGITSVFVVGLLLATARHYSRSTLLCFVLHATMNLIATIELLVTIAAI
jgi:membrane protease YdiL (CAAX protease family)